MKKNILFLFPDQHRAEFLRAITPSPLCAPARACLASGRRYDYCKVFNNDFTYPLSQRTFYSVLKEKRYNVGSVGKSDLHKSILYWGKNGWIGQLSTLGFTHAIDSEGKFDLLLSSSFFYEPIGPYANYLYKKGLLKDHCKDYIIRYLNANDTNAISLPEEAYDDNWVTQNALKILDKFKENNNPWFLMVNFTGPHNPWDITQRMKNRWKDIDFSFPNNSNMDREEINKVRQNYAAMLENIDSNIGLILNKVEEIGDMRLNKHSFSYKWLGYTKRSLLRCIS